MRYEEDIPLIKKMQSSGLDRKGSSKQESVLSLEMQSYTISDLAFCQNRNHKCNKSTLKHKAKINIKSNQKTSCKATRKQHLNF